MSNNKGSALNMEPVGAHRIFEYAPQTCGLRSSECYGDGDSKSFLRVKDVYEEKTNKIGVHRACTKEG